jgi:hypothetical protein
VVKEEDNNKTKCFIQEIDNFIPVIKTLQLINNKDTLVIFDIDDVLIIANEDNDFRHPYRAQLWQELKNRLLPEKIEILHSNIMSTIKWQLIEPRISKMFNYLKANNIPSIGLTAMGTGKFGIIKKKEDFRIIGLESVGLSFTSLTPLKGQELAIQLRNINMINEDSCSGIPMLKEGIIFTAGVDKGIVLEHMLNKYKYYPETIIFVDDLFINIESIQQLCLKLIINFYGFHYMATSFKPSPIIDIALEELRFKILEQEGYWLSYKQLINKKQLQCSTVCVVENNFYN